MMIIRFFCLASLFSLLIVGSSCKFNNLEDLQQPHVQSRYPAAIGSIFENRCATAGCHNSLSYQNAGGLRLDSWGNLFEGGSNGSAIIPFSPVNSPLLYFINTYPDLGNVAVPTMPLNNTPLTREEYLLIQNWVASGAPDIQGIIPFAANAATRQKIYMTMQGCDLVGVVDAEKRVLMRYIPVGKTAAIESPHAIRVDPAGNFAYLSFTAGDYVQKIDTRTDSIVGELNVGTGSWNILHVSDDGQKILLTNFNPLPGQPTLVMIDANTMQVIKKYHIPSNELSNPHGVASLPGFDLFFITRQVGNIVYKVRLSQGSIKAISIDENPPSPISSRDPHEIMLTPDNSKYFVTCQRSNEIRVMDAIADTLIKVINVGKVPQEIAISKTRPYMFFTCMADSSANAGFLGSVYAINYNSFETTRIDGPFYQPHGITVDDRNGTFYIVSRNVNPDGPAPHHSSSCEGKNGYYHVYDLNTFKRLPKRYEVSIDPYSADARFK